MGFSSGRVVDALTEGIPDALGDVLDVMEVTKLTWNIRDHTQAITDRQGTFSLPRGLPRELLHDIACSQRAHHDCKDNLTIFRCRNPCDDDY